MKKLMLTILTMALFWTVPFSVHADLFTPTVDSKAALVVDVQTGQVLADKNGSQRLPIASLSKLLTVYLVEKAIQDGRLTMTTPVKIPANIATFSQNSAVANVPLQANQTYTVKDLLNATLLPSANGAALALGYAVAGNEATFQQQMSDQLTAWGIKNVPIYSASGLSNADMGVFATKNAPAKAENRLSAREIAIVAQHLIKEFPSITAITRQSTAVFVGQTINNVNPLLSEKNSRWLGLKTGSTPYDGYNFVGLTTLAKRQVLTVVLNNKNFDDTFTDTQQLYAQTTAKVTLKTLAKGTLAQDEPTVLRAKTGKMAVATNQVTSLFVPKNQTSKFTLTDFKAQSFKLPAAKATVVGHMAVQASGVTADYLGAQPKVEMVTAKKVAAANWFVRTWRQLFEKNQYDLP